MLVAADRPELLSDRCCYIVLLPAVIRPPRCDPADVLALETFLYLYISPVLFFGADLSGRARREHDDFIFSVLFFGI